MTTIKITHVPTGQVVDLKIPDEVIAQRVREHLTAVNTMAHNLLIDTPDQTLFIPHELVMQSIIYIEKTK